MSAPPRLALWLIERVVAPADRAAAIGDLCEEFHARATAHGRREARRWFRIQAVRSLLPFLRRRLTRDGHRGRPHHGMQGRNPIMHTLMQDVRFALRTLARRPMITAIAVASLVAGLAATTTVFTLLNAVAYRALPVRSPAELGLVLEQRPRGLNHNFSYQDFLDFRGAQRAFTDLVAYANAQVALRRGDGSELVGGELVTGGFFDLLGIRILRGRGLTQADTATDAPPVIVASESLWSTLGDPDRPLDGAVVVLNGTTFAVVGVAASPFQGMVVGREARFWAPLTFQRVLASRNGQNLLAMPTASWLTILGRLGTGVTLEAAAEELTRVERGLPVSEFRPRTRGMVVVPGWQGDSMLPATTASPLRLLLAAALLVLAVACANVAGLQVVRSAERERELALRSALGATRGRVVRLMLVEASCLGLAATAIGLLIAWATTGLAVPLFAEFGRPVALDVSPDWRVFGFAAACGLAATIAFGLAPAAVTLRRSLLSSLAGANTTSQGASRTGALVRRSLVAVQFGLSLSLVVVAALLARTLYNLESQSTGLDLDHVALVEVDPTAGRLSPDRTGQYVAAALERLRGVPGMRAAGYARIMPLDFGGSRTTVEIQGYSPQQDEEMEINFNRVSSHYFDALGMAPMDGRLFDDRDRTGGPPAVVVNETMARRYWPGGRAVGGRLAIGPSTFDVIGVVPDVKYRTLRESPGPSFYLAAEQGPPFGGAFHLRTAGPPEAVLDAARRILAEVDPTVPITRARTLRDQLRLNANQDRAAATIAFGLAGAALLLAAVGLYGSMAHAVGQRTREIGVRMALGAVPGDVRRMVIREGVWLGLAGTAAGAVLGFVLARQLEHRLFGVTPADPQSFAAAAVLLALVALLASWIPARRAARINPLQALRFD